LPKYLFSQHNISFRKRKFFAVGYGLRLGRNANIPFRGKNLNSIWSGFATSSTVRPPSDGRPCQQAYSGMPKNFLLFAEKERCVAEVDRKELIFIILNPARGTDDLGTGRLS
jgi:hypothetical protein